MKLFWYIKQMLLFLLMAVWRISLMVILSVVLIVTTLTVIVYEAFASLAHHTFPV